MLFEVWCCEAHLPDVGALATHIGPCDDLKRLGVCGHHAVRARRAAARGGAYRSTFDGRSE